MIELRLLYLKLYTVAEHAHLELKKDQTAFSFDKIHPA